MEDKIATIKSWLGTGSVNIFGLPMSGKDTQGIKLAEALGGKFISSGMIIRSMESETRANYTKDGSLVPTDVFYEWVLPYFGRPDLAQYPLVLSSIGRWFGEEDEVMATARQTGHEIKAAVILNISESDVEHRFYVSKSLNDRGSRADDRDLNVFRHRLEEFREKTMPVIQHYKNLGLLVEVPGNVSRDDVFNSIINRLYIQATTS
ncbi:nucleoside monophosphate kinase [Candidatus Saccharibacteria bacterium]|nr:nucleoside monophosphate kinase [Candidatus Saccharibacteria bacterium]